MMNRIGAPAVALIGMGLALDDAGWLRNAIAGGNWNWLTLAATGALLLAAAALAWRQRSRLRGRLGALRERHDALMSAMLRLRDALGLAPLIGGPAVRALTERYREALARANRLTARLELAERRLAGWRLVATARTLREAEAEARSLEDESAELQRAMRLLKDESHESARVITELRALHADLLDWLCRRDWGWAEDVWSELARQASAVEEADRLRGLGDPVSALARCQEVRAVLLAQKRLLEARHATIRWLGAVPEELGRLEAEARRLAAAGYRDLPEVPSEALAAEARRALAAVDRGELSRASEAQQALRQRLVALRKALTGREELREANARELRALKLEIRALVARCDGISEAGSRERLHERLWRDAARRQDGVREALHALERSLSAAERANAMDAQRFDEAKDELKRLRTRLDELRGELAACQGQWRSLAAREHALQERMLALAAENGAIRARAQAIGVAPEPQAEALLAEARQAMRAKPLELDEAERAVAAAESGLMRMRARVESLEERLGRDVRAHGTVWLTREGRTSQAESERGRR